MNTKQQAVVILAILAFVIFSGYPPWLERVNIPYRAHFEKPIGYGFIASPPATSRDWASVATVSIDFSRLSLEWVLLGGLTLGLILALRTARPPTVPSSESARPSETAEPEGNPLEIFNEAPEDSPDVDLGSLWEVLFLEGIEKSGSSLSTKRQSYQPMSEEYLDLLVGPTRAEAPDGQEERAAPEPIADSRQLSEDPRMANWVRVGQRVYETEKDRSKWEAAMLRHLGKPEELRANLHAIWDEITGGQKVNSMPRTSSMRREAR